MENNGGQVNCHSDSYSKRKIQLDILDHLNCEQVDIRPFEIKKENENPKKSYKKNEKKRKRQQQSVEDTLSELVTTRWRSKSSNN